MAEHEHEFIGDADGVYCEICGLRMNPADYKEFISRKQKTAEIAEKQPKKRTPRKKEE